MLRSLSAVSVVMPPVSSFHRTTTLHCISSSSSMLRSLSARSLLSCLLYNPSITRHCTASLPVHPCCDHSLRGLCCHASCIIFPSHDTALHLFQFIHAAITLCAVSVVMPPVSSFHRTTLHCIYSSSSMLRSLSARSLLSCLLYHPSIARHCIASLPVHSCCDHSLSGLCCHASCIILPSHDTAQHLFQSIHAAITLCAVSVVMPPVSSFHRTTLHSISSSPSMLRSLSARSLLSCLLYHPSIARRHCTASLPVHPCCDHSLRGLYCHASCIILPSHDTALHLFQSIHDAITLCSVSVVMTPVSSFHRTTLQLFQSIHDAITLCPVSVVMPTVSSYHRTTMRCISSSSSMMRSLSARSLLSCLLYHPSIARHCNSSSPSMLRSLSARSLLSCLLYHPSIARRHCIASLSVHP